METSNDEDDRRDDCDTADADVKLQLYQFHQPTRLNADNTDDRDRSRKNNENNDTSDEVAFRHVDEDNYPNFDHSCHSVSETEELINDTASLNPTRNPVTDVLALNDIVCRLQQNIEPAYYLSRTSYGVSNPWFFIVPK